MSEAPKIYKQKRLSRTIIKVFGWIVCILLLLLIICLFSFRHYSCYTETGKLYLSIPWLSEYLPAVPTDDPLADELTATAGNWKNGAAVNAPFRQGQAVDTAADSAEASVPGTIDKTDEQSGADSQPSSMVADSSPDIEDVTSPEDTEEDDSDEEGSYYDEDSTEDSNIDDDEYDYVYDSEESWYEDSGDESSDFSDEEATE